MSFNITEFLGWLLALFFLGIVIWAILGFPTNSLGNLLPNFGDADKDKIIEGVVVFQEGETCCCLYENNINTKECKGVRLEINQYCKDKLKTGNWVHVDDEYCKK